MSWTTGTATDYIDALAKLIAFLSVGHSLPPVYTGTGTGRIDGILGSSTSIQEAITVTFSSSTAFSVAGSVTGAMGSGTVGTPFTHARVGFLVSQGGVNWANGDTITFVMTPPWVLRRCRGAKILASTFADTFYAFDVLPGTRASIASGSLPASLGIELLTADEITSFTLQAHTTTANTPAALSLEYSDNGSGWTTHQSWSGLTWTSAEIKTFTLSTSAGSHKYWRVRVTASNGSTTEVAEVVFLIGTRNALLAECIWQAPGNSDEDEIYVGVKAFSNSTGNYFNWRLGGFTGFDPAQPFESQAGSNTRTVLPLWNEELTYWFMADGAHLKVVAKVSTVFEQAYLGFLDTYATPGLWPYPLAIGGSMSWAAEPSATSPDWKYAYQGENHRAWWFPWSTGFNDANNCQMRIRKPDGVWTYIQSYYNHNHPNVWPYAFCLSDLRANIDGSVPVFPIIFTSQDGPNVWGEPKGVKAISGNGQTSENTVTIGRDVYLVVQNVYRVGTKDYAAFLLA